MRKDTFKKLISVARHFFKNHFTLLITIIILVVAIFTLIYTVNGVKIARESLGITKRELQKDQDPLFQYKYIANQGRFEVVPRGDVNIKTVSWITVPHLMKVNQNSNMLITDELKFTLLLELGSGKPDKIVMSFINCYLLGTEFFRGIPLAVEIEFRRRGEKDSLKYVDLIRVKGSERDEFYIDVINAGASIKDIAQYQEDAKEDYKIYSKTLESYKEEGKCRISFGYPTNK